LNASFDSVKSKRGRPAISESWTRVFEVPEDSVAIFQIYSINSELMLENAMPALPRGTKPKETWAPIFHPAEYLKKHPGMTIENCTLTKAKLLQYGK
jgi:hypothetical protein